MLSGIFYKVDYNKSKKYTVNSKANTKKQNKEVELITL